MSLAESVRWWLTCGVIEAYLTGSRAKGMYQFSFLPYFPADDLDLKVNRLHLFNFWNHKNTYIPDADVKQRLERICSFYVDTSLERLDEFTIAVYRWELCTQSANK
jgi:hypothetical protein